MNRLAPPILIGAAKIYEIEDRSGLLPRYSFRQEALERIGSENQINRRRVKRYGVEVGDEDAREA